MKEEQQIEELEQQNDFTEKKSLGSRKGMIALLFILVALMGYGFLHSLFKSDTKSETKDPQTKVVKEIKSESNKSDYSEQNKKIEKQQEENTTKDIPYQKVEPVINTVDTAAAQAQAQAQAAAAAAAKEAQAAANKAAAAEEQAATSAIKFNINSSSSNADKPANQGKAGYVQIIQ